MKLYKTQGFTTALNDQSKIRWSGTQADARKDRNALKAEDIYFQIDTEEVEIPTSKAELIAFLNDNDVDLTQTPAPETD